MEKSTARGITLPDFKKLLQNYSNQNSRVLAQKQTHRSMEQKESLERNPYFYGQLIYDKGGKNIQWGKECLFNKWSWVNWIATCKRINWTTLSHMPQNKFKMH